MIFAKWAWPRPNIKPCMMDPCPKIRHNNYCGCAWWIFFPTHLTSAPDFSHIWGPCSSWVQDTQFSHIFKSAGGRVTPVSWILKLSVLLPNIQIHIYPFKTWQLKELHLTQLIGCHQTLQLTEASELTLKQWVKYFWVKYFDLKLIRS